ncbi:MAG: aminotransferase class I/II-fold pyridoxal phosphate-dependent enzyme [Alphaproteobacteria bacterium]
MSLTTDDYKSILSEAIKQLRESPTFAVVKAVAARKAKKEQVLDFSVGQPAEPTPDYVRQSLLAMIQDDAKWAEMSKYTPTSGNLALKEAVVTKMYEENGIAVGLENVLITAGGKQALANAFAATINPGDEVLMSDVQWVSYPDMVKFHGGKPVELRTNKEFKFTAETLRATLAEHPDAKWLLINSPSNPTGAVYSKDELKELADVVLDENRKRKSESRTPLMVLSDDIYEHMVYDEKLLYRADKDDAVSYNIVMAEPDIKPYTVMVNGVAKTFGMTGYRIGYAVGPEELIKRMDNYQGMETSGASAISQMTALAALSKDNAALRNQHFARQREAYKKRRDRVDELINRDTNTSMKFTPTDGAFYAMIDVTEMANAAGGTHALADSMIKEKGVALVAGDDFYLEPGKQQRKFLRLSYATSEENIQRGIELMKELEQEILPPGQARKTGGRGA